MKNPFRFFISGNEDGKKFRKTHRMISLIFLVVIGAVFITMLSKVKHFTWPVYVMIGFAIIIGLTTIYITQRGEDLDKK